MAVSMAKTTVSPLENKSNIDRHSERIKALEQGNQRDRELLESLDRKLSPAFIETIQDIKDQLDGNGKPGFKAIRDKVLSWEAKLNALGIAVIIDIVIRVIAFGAK